MSKVFAPFPAGHWSTNWSMLAGIAEEFQAIRELYAWSEKLHDKTVAPYFQSVIEDERNQRIVEFYLELGSDPIVLQILMESINEYVTQNKLGWTSEAIREQLYVRLNIKAWRNASTWIQNRNEKGERWCYFLNPRNLRMDITRTVKVLNAINGRRRLKSDPPTPAIFAVSAHVEKVGSYDHGFDFTNAVLEYVDRGIASREEGKIFIDWYGISDQDDCNQVIVAKHNLSLDVLYDILRKFGTHL